MLDAAKQDLSYGARRMRKHPGFTLMAALTLALGIGASTAIFTVVNGVLLRPLAYPEPDRLVRVFETVEREAMSSDRMEVAPANYLDWQSQTQSFAEVAAYGFGDLALAGDEEAERVPSAYVSANLLATLGVNPVLGRSFTLEEDTPGNDNVALLGYGLWRQRFGGDSNVLGKTITLDGFVYTVIGVMPAGFRFPKEAVLWTPLSLNANQVKMREARFLKVIARLKPEATVVEARAELDALAARFAEQYPETNRNWGVNVVPLMEEEVGRIRPALLVLFAAVGLILLIACANIANLLLARASGRQSEIAVRLALGASRRRIVRQLLIESLMLALLGGAAGLLAAVWGVDVLLALAPDNLPRLAEVSISSRVLGFAIVVSCLTGIVFGLIPALQASKPELQSALKEGAGKSSGSASRRGAANALVILEMAVAMVVMIGAGLVINSFLRLQRVDSGLDAANVLTVEFTPPSARYSHPDRWRENRLNFFRQLIPRVEAFPGVQAVGAIDSLPLGGDGRVYGFRKDGEGPAGLAATFQVATPGYFSAMGIQLKRGRLFVESDERDKPQVVIVNETMARRFWPDDDAIGNRIVIRNDRFAREIIGVVGDVKQFGLDRDRDPEMYVPFNQVVIDVMPLVIRTSNEPALLVGAVRNEVRAVDPEVAIAKIRTMPQVVADSLAQKRFTVLLMGIFAAAALALAAVGTYGVVSYAVSQRTREIGIRMALGAAPRDVLKLVLGHGMLLALIGVAIGVGAALALTRLMSSLLFGVSATDPATFLIIGFLLGSVAVVACYVPARRATKVDPTVALRHE